jgi:hypothetical protein
VVFSHLQRLANRLDAPIHHVRWRNHLRARLSVGQGLTDQRIDRDVVLHIAMFVENAVLAMSGEGVQRNVSDDAELRESLTQGPGGALGDALGIPGFRRIEGFLLQRSDRKQRQRRNAQRDQFSGLFQQQIDGKTLHAGHRRHLLAAIFAVENKHGQDQVIHAQSMLAYQSAGKIITTIATQPSGGEQAIGRNETHNELLARRTGEYDVYKPTS